MTHDQLSVLFIIGGCILALVAAASLLLAGGAEEQKMALRIGGLRHGAAVARPPSTRFRSMLTSLMRRLGNVMRDRMLSARDTETLAKTLAASGFEPSRAIPIFMGAKVACLFAVPAPVYLGVVLLGYPMGKQVLYAGLSLAVAMMLPNFVTGLIRRRYQEALRRGLPDALDLMVVCAEAGLGLESTVARVAQEMMKSNRSVGVEFSMFTHDMRIMPDRRVALARMAERSGQPSLKRLAATLAHTLKYGTPLSQGLRTLAAEMRNERLIQFEERAGKLPALLTLPMMVLIMPCLFIILLGQPISMLMGVFASMQH